MGSITPAQIFVPESLWQPNEITDVKALFGEAIFFSLYHPELCQEASSGEVFLLASAALANITFFDTMACEMLLQLNAIRVLLEACSDKQRVDTPYTRDQVRSSGGTKYSARDCEDRAQEARAGPGCAWLVLLGAFCRKVKGNAFNMPIVHLPELTVSPLFPSQAFL